MKHIAVNSFWNMFEKLPPDVQINAKRHFELLKSNPYHPSLHLKKVNDYWSIRIGIKFRALGMQDGESIIWFWIGKHDEYEKLI
jgi:hypothetical protein